LRKCRNITRKWLIDTLIRAAIEHAGAERGLLIRLQGGEQWLEAEGTTSGDSVLVRLRDEQAGPAALPESMLHVLSAGESVILDDAAAQSASADDRYIRDRSTISYTRPCASTLARRVESGKKVMEDEIEARTIGQVAWTSASNA
jgi:hypothetical protein